MFAFSSEYSEVHDHSNLCESKLQSPCGCPESSHFCTCDGWVRCSNEAWQLLEVVVTEGERQSIFNKGQFYGGLECQGRDVEFRLSFDVEGQCRDSTLFYEVGLFYFFIRKKVGAVSCTNFNHFRCFGLVPKCNGSGGSKCIYFCGQISDQIGKSGHAEVACLSILRN